MALMEKVGITLAALVGGVALIAQDAGPMPQPMVLSAGPNTALSISLKDKHEPLVWSGGTLLMSDGNSGAAPSVFGVNGQGQTTFSATLSVPDANVVRILSLARGQDGAVVASGYAVADDGRAAPFLAWWSADGLAERIVRLGPYAPRLVTVASDNTVWTVGYEVVDGFERTGLEHGVIRHFDQTGHEIGSYVPRSTIKDKVRLVQGFLAASDDRVGWLSTNEVRDDSGDTGVYVEVSQTGVVRTYDVPKLPGQLIFGFALTRSGQPFFCAQHPAPSLSGALYRLDRSSGTWAAVSVPQLRPADYPPLRLFGADGDSLVVGNISQGPDTIRFLAKAN
jgi:hypothetical protein